MDSCPTLQAAVAGTMAVDNNKSAYCALGGAAQAPRAVDILTLSKVLASTTSSQVSPATHATQPMPCPISLMLLLQTPQRAAQQLSFIMGQLGAAWRPSSTSFRSRCYQRPAGLVYEAGRGCSSRAAAISLRCGRLAPRTGDGRSSLCICLCVRLCVFS